MVLVVRGQRSGTVLWSNGPILAFFLYGAVSALWSDFPEVAFKRWVKFLGNFVMVLIVLTDPNPSAAVKRLLVRTGFILIPLSVLFIKYYPELGRSYDQFTYKPFFSGVAVSKNSLGIICLILGLGSVWRFLEAYRSAERPRLSGPLVAHGVILIMVLWLFSMANSSTSLACFLVGSGLLLLTSLRRAPLTPMTLNILFVAVVSLAFFGLFIDANAGLVEALGRDATLSTRTDLWAELLQMNSDPLIGAGFESFWLGKRAKMLWQQHWWHPNQAHNGYLELFLNEGWIGLVLLGFLMTWGYRNVVHSLNRDSILGGLKVSFFIITVLYNLTEATFKAIHPVWIIFLLAVTVVPDSKEQENNVGIQRLQ